MGLNVKRIAVSLARRLAESPFAAVLRSMSDGSPHLLRVLTYHRIDWQDRRPDLSPETLSATPTDFADQMECLARSFQVVSLDQVRDAVANGCDLPPWSVLLTFDDAYEDFRDHAWPVLRRLGLPATLFVATGFPDRPDRVFWWDRLYAAICRSPGHRSLVTRWGRFPLESDDQRREAAARITRQLERISHRETLTEVERIVTAQGADPSRPAVLGWDDLRQLAHDGVSLAPHTRTHPLMNRIPLDEAREEAVGSLQDLCNEIGAVPPVFAYPGGSLDARISRMLSDEGFELAFTTARGVNHLQRCSPILLRRINVGRRTTRPMLELQLRLRAECLNPFWPLPDAVKNS